MRERVKWASLAAICALLVLSTFSSACARSLITARIVDSESGLPIQEATLAYRWYKYKFSVPGLPTEDVTIEAGEEISDNDGTVKIPKYSMLVNKLDMVAYKRGYVCWSSSRIFPSWEERKDFKLEDGTMIRVAPFKEEYSPKDHAWFIQSVSGGIPLGPSLGEALTKELQLLHKK